MLHICTHTYSYLPSYPPSTTPSSIIAYLFPKATTHIAKQKLRNYFSQCMPYKSQIFYDVSLNIPIYNIITKTQGCIQGEGHTQAIGKSGSFSS